MLAYIVKRILLFAPTLIVISLITFAISVQTPGDPAIHLLRGMDQYQMSSYADGDESYQKLRRQLGLNKPLFYFTIGSYAEPDTLHRIKNEEHKDALKRLLSIYGNWPAIQNYYRESLKLNDYLNKLHEYTVNKETALKAKQLWQRMIVEDDLTSVLLYMEEIANMVMLSRGPRAIEGLATEDHFQLAGEATAYIHSHPEHWKNWIPSWHYHGIDNQYHHWASNFIQGDFGKSFTDGQAVSNKIWIAMKRTLLITSLAILLSYLIAIPLGVYLGQNAGSKSEQIISNVLFGLYAAPVFWIASLAILYLTGGGVIDIFPTFGLGSEDSNMSNLESFLDKVHHLILPVLCFSYPSLAFLSRHTRNAILNALGQDYIKTARAKGLPLSKVVWKHALKNAALPQITIIASLFPALIGGSIILEQIFSIQGMGKLAYDAVLARDYPIVFSIMMIGALLTVVGYLIGDILYAFLDPRIRFNREEEE